MQNDVQPYALALPDLSSWLISLWHWIEGIYPVVIDVIKHIVGILVTVSIPVSVFFVIGIVYCVEGLKKIRNKEEEVYELKVEPAFDVVDKPNVASANRWENALKHIESANPNDWKQAILEADIILDDLLSKMGYRGESIGEKLKRVEKGDMKTLNEAWEAHKVRNQIAHEGATFALTQHDAKKVMHMYRKVFEEFYYI